MKQIVLVVVLALSIGMGTFGCGSSTPDYPTSLSATIGAGKVYLIWGPATLATGYNVYRGLASGQVATKTKIAANVSSTTYTDSAVSVGTNYYYQVTALIANIETQPSNEVLGSP